jgi:hypothetical protein
LQKLFQQAKRFSVTNNSEIMEEQTQTSEKTEPLNITEENVPKKSLTKRPTVSMSSQKLSMRYATPK